MDYTHNMSLTTWVRKHLTHMHHSLIVRFSWLWETVVTTGSDTTSALHPNTGSLSLSNHPLLSINPCSCVEHASWFLFVNLPWYSTDHLPLPGKTNWEKSHSSAGQHDTSARHWPWLEGAYSVSYVGFNVGCTGRYLPPVSSPMWTSRAMLGCRLLWWSVWFRHRLWITLGNSFPCTLMNVFTAKF